MKFSRVFISSLAIVLISISCHADTFVNFDEIRKIDSYGKLSWKEEKERLSALAFEFQKGDSKDFIYLYFYGGEHTCLHKVRKRVLKAKNYLIKKHAIPSERIILVEGGYHKELTIDVFIQPQSFELAPTPTLGTNEQIKKCS